MGRNKFVSLIPATTTTTTFAFLLPLLLSTHSTAAGGGVAYGYDYGYVGSVADYGNLLGSEAPPPPPSEISPASAVVDLDGKPLKAGDTYMIMFGKNAGVGVEQSNQTCPLYVAQQPFAAAVHRPIRLTFHKFISARDEAAGVLKPGEIDTIFENTPVAVEFKTNGNGDGGLLCKESMMWQVVREAVGVGAMKRISGFVKTGGSLDADGIDVPQNSKFRIIKVSGTKTPVYKLLHCHPAGGVMTCRDVGKFADTEATRPVLVVGNAAIHPVYIEFKKT